MNRLGTFPPQKFGVIISRPIIKDSNSSADWDNSPHKGYLRWKTCQSRVVRTFVETNFQEGIEFGELKLRPLFLERYVNSKSLEEKFDHWSLRVLLMENCLVTSWFILLTHSCRVIRSAKRCCCSYPSGYFQPCPFLPSLYTTMASISYHPLTQT